MTQAGEPELAAPGRPVWQGNNESKTCTKCDRSFSVYHRRHHCRGCGKLVCDKCSSHRVQLQESYGYGPGKHRVCTECFDTVLSLKYEENLEKGTAQPLDYPKLRSDLMDLAAKYLELPKSGWTEKVDRGIKIATQQFPGHPIFVVRSEVLVKAPLQKARSVYGSMSVWKHWNPHVSSRIIEIIDENSKVFVAAYDFPVINKRNSCFFSCTIPGLLGRQDAPEGSITTMARSVDHPLCPPEPGTVRATIMLSITMLEPVEDGKFTRFSSLVHSDPRGLIPPFLINRFLSRGADHLRGMADYIESH